MIIYFLKFETEFFVLQFLEKKLFIGVVLLCGQTILIPLSCVHNHSHCLQFSNCQMQRLIGGYGIHWAVLRRFLEVQMLSGNMLFTIIRVRGDTDISKITSIR